MNRILLIPVAGTLAAIVAVALARGEREDSAYPIIRQKTPTPPTPEPSDQPAPPEVKPPVPKPTMKRARKYLMEIKEDDTFVVTAYLHKQDMPEDETVDFKSIEAFLDTAAPENGPRPVVHLFTTSANVTPQDIEKIASQLRGRCEVVIQPRLEPSTPEEK